MKSLVPWMCVVLATLSQPSLAEDDFHAYRLGDYTKAAENLLPKSGKNAIADYYLARLYLYGYGELRNTDLAMRYFNKAAEQGYLPAILIMAKYSLFHDKNLETALGWFKKAANAGDVSSQLFMTAAYLYGIGVKPNQDLAIKYDIEAAKNGNALAQFTLADNFLSSKHSGNSKLGLIWLNKAAAAGNANALSKLGSLYLSGKFVSKNTSLGLNLLNQAARLNQTQAMLELGDLALSQQKHKEALEWYEKAIKQNDSNAFLHLAHAYLQEKSPIYDAKTGYLWTLKASDHNVPGAKAELSKLYEKGLGVNADPELAKQWALLASQESKQKPKSHVPPLEQAALWLSNGASKDLQLTGYQMQGIFSAWQNTNALKNNIYNKSPQLDTVTRADIFKPQFSLIQANEVPITDYYQALIRKNELFQSNQWTYPTYHLNKNIEALEKEYSLVLNKQMIPAPYANASYFNDSIEAPVSLMDRWTEGWQQYSNFMSVFNPLYFRAVLGDAQSQFEIGQLFQYGIGAPQNIQAAIVFYQNAAIQQHLGAEYNLGILYLQHPQDTKSYDQALNWLTNAAFKGNSKSQYVLSHLLDQGLMGQDGKYLIKPNQEQAQSMLYLAAARGYAPAEFDLAQKLAQQNDDALNLDVKQHKIALIRNLYNGAAEKGIVQALIPLAFYNAQEQNKESQEKAFKIASNLAGQGSNKAALLLGLLYDRGIGVSQNSEKALYWYQQAETNLVSQFILGTYTALGTGLSKDVAKGMDLLKQSADNLFSYADFNLAALEQQAGKEFLPHLTRAFDLGNSHAGIVLADYYLSVNNDLEKLVQAQRIYSGLASKGDQYAQLKLAFMFEKGLNGRQDAASALQWYTASAMQGNALAQFLLGRLYQLGESAEPDYTLAKEWYQKAAATLAQASNSLGFIDETVEDNYSAALKAYEQAAAKGDAKGIYNLALMYLYGKGIPVDYSKAKGLLTEAANKGIHEAMAELADLQFNGLGQTQDAEQALAWYKKAADHGNTHALYQLGLLSETGLGMKADPGAAIKYYQRASEKGEQKAMMALARIYHFGHNSAKDNQLSVDLFQKLARKQNAYAQYRLGTFYLSGDRSIDKSREWLKQAHYNGYAQAASLLQGLDARSQNQSYIEPIIMNQVTQVRDQTPESMYFEALNEWNQGNETQGRMILKQILAQYPDFSPAKEAVKSLN